MFLVALCFRSSNWFTRLVSLDLSSCLCVISCVCLALFRKLLLVFASLAWLCWRALVCEAQMDWVLFGCQWARQWTEMNELWRMSGWSLGPWVGGCCGFPHLKTDKFLFPKHSCLVFWFVFYLFFICVFIFVLMFWLCAFSFKYIRKRWYICFMFQHFTYPDLQNMFYVFQKCVHIFLYFLKYFGNK